MRIVKFSFVAMSHLHTKEKKYGKGYTDNLLEKYEKKEIAKAPKHYYQKNDPRCFM
jgi:hypothetical protein